MFQAIQKILNKTKMKTLEQKLISGREQRKQVILALIEPIEDESKICELIDYSLCPDCGEWEFYTGPSGGMSTNYMCGYCGSEFNHCFGFVSQRICRIPTKELNNAVPVTPLIIRTWYKVDLFNPRESMKNRNDALAWCGDESTDEWCLNSYYFYFREEADAVAFKLRWI